MTPPPSAVVFGTVTPFGRRVAQALDHAEIAVVAIDVDLDDRSAVADAVAAADVIEPVDRIVYAHVDPQCLEARSFVDVDPEQWDARCERQLRMFLHVVQASHRLLARSRGALVCVCPTIALQGAADLAMFAAVAEGQRILAKSAARQWANDGIRVNIVSPAVHELLDQPVGPGFVDACRGRTPITSYDTDAALRGGRDRCARGARPLVRMRCE